MLLWFLVAMALDKSQLIIAAPGYGSAYCGVGTTDRVLHREADAPMAYRVLVPWLIGALERLHPRIRKSRLEIYEAIKIAVMGLALWAVSSTLGVTGALLVAVLLSVTWSYDYWDWAVELGALALAVGGNMQGAIIGGIALALSRETAPLVPLTYLLATGDVSGTLVIALAVGLTWLGVRLWAGYHKLYCERFMWKRNLESLRSVFHCRPVFMANTLMSAGITAATLGLLIMGRLGPTWPVPLVLLAIGWLMGIAYETRVFASCLLWIALGARL